MKIGFRDVVEFLFLPLLSAAVFILWDLNKSVNTLNVQVGVLIANNSTLKERIDTLEKRMEKVEDKVLNPGNLAGR